MTNDSKKGWKYKLQTDRNQRLRRDPDVRRRTERFRRDAKKEGRWYCHSKSRLPHGGELEVQHVGGIKPKGKGQRLTVFCERHNRADEGMRPHGKPRARLRARPRTRTDLTAWIVAGVGLAVAWIVL